MTDKNDRCFKHFIMEKFSGYILGLARQQNPRSAALLTMHNCKQGHETLLPRKQIEGASLIKYDIPSLHRSKANLFT